MLITEMSLALVTTLIVLSYFTESALQMSVGLLGIAAMCGAHTAALTSKWLMYAIFLVFLGGMMVVFIYSTVLAGNQKQNTRLKYRLLLAPIALITVVVVMVVPSHETLAFSTLYSSGSSWTPMALILILLFALFIIVKIVENFKGTLVKQFA